MTIRRSRRAHRARQAQWRATATGGRRTTAGSGGAGGVVGGGTSAFVPAGETPTILRRRPPVAPAAAALLSSSSPSLADDMFQRGGYESQAHQRHQKRAPCPKEPFLFDIPPELRPTYGDMPILLRAGIWVASALLVGRRSLARILPHSSFSFRASPAKLVSPASGRLLSPYFICKALFFLLRIALVSAVAKLAIQESFYPPSRATTEYLAQRGELPSSLSRYQQVTPLVVAAPATRNDGKIEVQISASSWDEGNSAASTSPPIGVHSIQYTKRTNSNANHSDPTRGYEGIYLYHGFGASSLSWLPALPTLVEQLGSGRSKCVGVAHDAPGFGFTDRPDGDESGGLEQYGSENNAGIGLALLKESLAQNTGATNEISEFSNGAVNNTGVDAKSIAIFGHSMGAKAAMLMALHCASHPELGLKLSSIVLVAPALEGVSLPPRRGNDRPPKASAGALSESWLRKMSRRFWIAWRKLFLDYPFQFGLRRLVCGSKDFWRRGLTLAWGDPARLSDSDVLRFQWPSIGRGWEEGLVNFSRAQLLPSSTRASTWGDVRLLREVVNLRDTRVVIMYGSKDRVVRIDGGTAESLKKEYPSVRLVRMEGLGHDPFEEDVESFLDELEKALE